MTRTKIAVLGGGVGAMTTAFHLTSVSGWRERYDVTVYQIGWGVGGQGGGGGHQGATPPGGGGGRAGRAPRRTRRSGAGTRWGAHTASSSSRRTSAIAWSRGSSSSRST